MSHRIRKGTWWVLVMALATVGLGQAGWADDVAELTQRLEALQQQVDTQNAELVALRQKVTQLGAGDSAGAQATSQSVTDRVATLEKQSKALETFSKIGWYGDFRLRFWEGTVNQDHVVNQHRARIRFRLGGTYPITDQLEFGARLSTGGTDGDSAHTTLGDLFTKDSFDLDRYYLRYKPLDGLDLVGGKFENPFWATQTTWDTDLQPEGFAGVYTLKEVAGLLDSVSLRSGLYTVSELSGDDDAFMLPNQVVLSKKLAEDWKIESGLAAYLWHKKSTLTAVTNTTDASGNLLSDFKVLDHITKLTYEGWQQPVSLLFDYGHNLGAAPGTGDDSYGVEALVGKIKKPWNWQLKYEFAHIQQDATLAFAAGNDTTPETNMFRHRWVAGVRVVKNTDLEMEYFVFRRDRAGATSTTDEDNWLSRVRLQVVTKF